MYIDVEQPAIPPRSYSDFDSEDLQSRWQLADFCSMHTVVSVHEAASILSADSSTELARLRHQPARTVVVAQPAVQEPVRHE